jgi:hypothetical protein
MKSYDLSTTSMAIEAACRLNLELKDNGDGADTLESFTELFEDFCPIFDSYPDVSIQDAIDMWFNELQESLS